ncbi:hypothetical protein J6590_003523 [Homalodisca vitripennis]|nr:hypothetical protein J6590_003523 [Homalodisca vitripennis]
MGEESPSSRDHMRTFRTADKKPTKRSGKNKILYWPVQKTEGRIADVTADQQDEKGFFMPEIGKERERETENVVMVRRETLSLVMKCFAGVNLGVESTPRPHSRTLQTAINLL